MSYAWSRPGYAHLGKRLIYGALAYLVNPADAIPDPIPFAGFSDDLGVLTDGLFLLTTFRSCRGESVQHVTHISDHVPESLYSMLP